MNAITPSASGNNSKNNLTIENATVKLLDSDYSANASGNYVAYKFSNSTLDLASSENSKTIDLTNYIFSSIEFDAADAVNANGDAISTQLTIDVDLSQFDEANQTYKADTVTIANNGSAKGVVKLAGINFASRDEKTAGIVRILYNANNNFYLDIAEMMDKDADGKYKWEYNV